MDSISLISTLPHAFAGMEAETAIANSDIWLYEVTFRRGSRYLLQAESGAGKSSLCNFIFGLRCGYSGKILFDDVDSSTLSITDWCKIRSGAIAYLPQEMKLFPELTVEENILIKNRLTHHRTMRWIVHALEQLEIADKLPVEARYLSVGQQQRVAAIRALCQPFQFLLLDEPVSHLDARNNAALASLISQTATAEGAGIIATSVGNPLSLTYDFALQL